MRFLGLAAFVAGASALAFPARATDCPGTPGYSLTIPATVSLGHSFTTCIEAPAGSLAFVLISPDQGPYMTKYGPLCVGVPLFNVWPLLIPPEGALCVDHFVACEDEYDGITGYFQAVVIGPNPGDVGLTNGASITAQDTGSCIPPGDFHSYTPGAWGAKCAGGNIACVRDANFDFVFPNDLVLGDQDGVDGDGHFALVLTSAKAVENYLPAGQTAGALDQDLVDPTGSTSAGVFAGHLSAAKLNVGFDDAGVFDALKNQVAVKLGDLLYSGGVHEALVGKSVREVIDLSDLAISGAIAEPFDVDGDLVGDVLFTDLSGALQVLNENFDNGTVNEGNLKLP